MYKHTVEPYATYRYQTGISNFADIIRFDYRDILADTNEVEYGVVNRLYAKKTTLFRQMFPRSPLPSCRPKTASKMDRPKRERGLLR